MNLEPDGAVNRIAGSHGGGHPEDMGPLGWAAISLLVVGGLGISWYQWKRHREGRKLGAFAIAALFWMVGTPAMLLLASEVGWLWEPVSGLGGIPGWIVALLAPLVAAGAVYIMVRQAIARGY